ncbi:MAG: 4-hydroxy-tetrahydrodipicolinate synthase [Holosporaceae bacterium]|jgi:4-hydroxy-tetrahydrodipicolinate synthase|nr:4-hydroxy-tetrahydrodipicolinate synthase [Holosporaceae bacterium]
MFCGYFAAIVSPFREMKLDFVSLEKYLAHLIGSGISGVVVCGSTGESLLLSPDERLELVRATSVIAGGKVKVIAGTLDPSTNNCVRFMRQVEHFVDGFLCICPFFIKPSQSQIYTHFERLSASIELPIILYNNPARTGVKLDFETFIKLSQLKNILAIKECAADLSVFAHWRSALNDIGKEFNFLAGNDEVAPAAMAMGASGAISVSANVAPILCQKMYEALNKQDMEKFKVLRDDLDQLHRLMFEEPSPAPVKYALSRLGMVKNELRAPLCPVGLILQEKIDLWLRKIGLL